jgi:hypothetical protein
MELWPGFESSSSCIQVYSVTATPSPLFNPLLLLITQYYPHARQIIRCHDTRMLHKCLFYHSFLYSHTNPSVISSPRALPSGYAMICSTVSSVSARVSSNDCLTKKLREERVPHSEHDTVAVPAMTTGMWLTHSHQGQKFLRKAKRTSVSMPECASVIRNLFLELANTFTTASQWYCK